MLNNVFSNVQGAAPLIMIFAGILLLILIIATGYVKAPPDKAYIISGLRRKPRVLIGQAGIKVPFLERVDVLYLGQMTVDIKTEQSVPTNDFINVNVDAVAKVRIGATPEAIQLAAKNFLNKNPDSITLDLQDSLQGNMREIIGTLALKTINTDRDSFSDQVMEKASKDMQKLGIEILSCNIQNVTDEKGLISDLGMDNTSRIKKDAAIAKAQAERDVAIAQAEASRYAAEQEAAGIKARFDAEAAGIAAKGKAEAESIRAKGLAEAEAMEKKAEAYRKYNGAAMAEMMIKIMPQMAAEIAKPLSQIDKINIYGTGDGTNGAAQISGNMPVVMKQVFDTMSEATGVDFTEIMRAGTYDAKVNRKIELSGTETLT